MKALSAKGLFFSCLASGGVLVRVKGRLRRSQREWGTEAGAMGAAPKYLVGLHFLREAHCV